MPLVGYAGQVMARRFDLNADEEFDPRDLPPEAGLPSQVAYRGAVLALVVASVVAVILFLNPPESRGSRSEPRVSSPETPVLPATATPTAPGSGPTRTPTPVRTTSPTATAAATTPTGSERTYTVAAGDTISAIAARFSVDEAELLALNPGVRPETLQIGQVLRIPPAR
jgi:hypothetical protein